MRNALYLLPRRVQCPAAPVCGLCICPYGHCLRYSSRRDCRCAAAVALFFNRWQWAE